jgi:hypothetical protein
VPSHKRVRSRPESYYSPLPTDTMSNEDLEALRHGHLPYRIYPVEELRAQLGSPRGDIDRTIGVVALIADAILVAIATVAFFIR